MSHHIHQAFKLNFLTYDPNFEMQTSINKVTCMLCNITCFIADYSLLGCHTTLLVEYLLTFLRIIVPSKCWIYTPNNTVSHPRRLESSATPMRDPPVSHRCRLFITVVGLWHNGWWQRCPVVRGTEATHCYSKSLNSTSKYSASGWSNISIGRAQRGKGTSSSGSCI